MPNWCTTKYVIEGPKKDISLIEKAIEKHDTKENSSESWEGNILIALGIDPTKYEYMRGFIEEPAEVSESNTEDFAVLEVWATEAWGVTDFNEALKEKFPDIHVFYYGEEPGMEIYCTNDAEGKYFPDRYYVDACIDNEYFAEFFITEKEALEYVSDITKGKVKTNEEIDDYNTNCNEDDWISVYEINIDE